MDNKTITEFLSGEYKEYAMYSIENRAIPSCIDGLKPTQRKIIHVASKIWKTGNEKTLKVFQLSGKVASDAYYHHGDCLSEDTEIMLADGTNITIGEWFNRYPDKDMEVICYDEEKKEFTKGIGHSPRIGHITNEEYEIEMEDGCIIRCTSNHPFLTNRGWIEAKDLKEDDNIINLSLSPYMKIKSINKKILDSEKNFYDITVDRYHNFLIGKSMLVTHNSSLSNAIINLAQSFKNNAPLLEEDGQFGSLRSPEAGAPRYIGTKLSYNFRLIYKDYELLKFKKEEGELIEPYFFLPIIPMVLVNGSQGIAVGFASNILNRDLKEVINKCKLIIQGKKIKTIKPSLKNFKGDWIQDEENPLRWIIRGKFEIKNTTTIEITELPPSMTYEKYESILDKLLDDKVIQDYEDKCKDDVNYTIKFKREDLSKLKHEDIFKLLKLEESQTEILTTLDDENKLKIFNSVPDIIEYFVDFRIKYYQLRKDYFLSKLKNDLKILGNKGKFIKLILENKIVINNKSKENIIIQIENNNIDKIDESYDYLLRMPIYSLTKELFEKLKQDFKTKKEEVLELEKKEPKQMYLDDLNEVLKKC